MKLRLSFVSWEYPRTTPILNGTVQPEGIELVPTKSFPSDTFWRAFRFNEFDISEMSLASFTIAKSRGEAPWIGIPIFPCRNFFYTHIWARKEVKGPADLKGKKFGLPEYQMTAAVWLRGILQEYYGVKPEDMEWYQERTDDRIPIHLPQNVSLKHVSSDKGIHQMLLDGELDAILYLPHSSLIDRSSLELQGNPTVHPLFADRKAEEIRFFKETGIFPANHAIVIKEEVVKKYPWVPLNVYVAFEEAKRLSMKGIYDYSFVSAPHVIWQNEALDEQAKTFGPDPYQYGLEHNRKMVEKITDYCFQQGLAARKVEPEELFAQSTLEQ